MRRETLSCAPDDDGDGVAWTECEDIGASVFGDGADAMEEKEVSVERDLKIGFWGKVRSQGRGRVTDRV